MLSNFSDGRELLMERQGKFHDHFTGWALAAVEPAAGLSIDGPGSRYGTVAIKFVHAMWIGKAGEQRFRFEGRAVIGLSRPRLSALRIAAIQAGHAAIHHNHCRGAAFCAQLRTFRKVRL
jgi:hypothetical protein